MKTKLVIFGLTGDLGRRKLIPALDSLLEKTKFYQKKLKLLVFREEKSSLSKFLKARSDFRAQKIRNFRKF